VRKSRAGAAWPGVIGGVKSSAISANRLG
jgi:hypothetical protein